MHRSLAAALALSALLWTASLLAAPLIVQHGPARMVPAAAVVYAAGGFICHQRPERSFRLAGVQVPVCARCLGLYLSGTIGALAALLAAGAGGGTPSGRRMLLGAAALPTAVTLGLEVLGLAHPSNVVRAIAALPLGAAAGWLFVRLLRADAGGKVARVMTRDDGPAARDAISSGRYGN